LGDAVKAIDDAERKMSFPTNITGKFTGTAQAFQAALANQPLLILAALITVYIVLGVLYESLIHPFTILSTLPSAGVGALLALLLCGLDLSVIAIIGIILLIGIVKKNAIMVIDVALDLERHHGLGARDAVHRACVQRFRPILMTTMAALLGALPLALGTGTGSELRRPLGITVVGGLLLSQLLTLYTTPVIYLYMERFRLAVGRVHARTRAVLGLRPATHGDAEHQRDRMPDIVLVVIAAVSQLATAGIGVWVSLKQGPRRVPLAIACLALAVTGMCATAWTGLRSRATGAVPTTVERSPTPRESRARIRVTTREITMMGVGPLV